MADVFSDLPQKHNAQILVSDDGTLYASSLGGLIAILGPELSPMSPHRTKSGQCQGKIVQTKSGDIWHTLYNGLYQYVPSTNLYVHHKFEHSGKEVTSDFWCLGGDDDELFLKVDTLLVVFDLDSLEFTHAFPYKINSAVRSYSWRSDGARIEVAGIDGSKLITAELNKANGIVELRELLLPFSPSSILEVGDVYWMPTSDGYVYTVENGTVSKVEYQFDTGRFGQFTSWGKWVLATQGNLLHLFDSDSRSYIRSYQFLDRSCRNYIEGLLTPYVHSDSTLFIGVDGEGILRTSLAKANFDYHLPDVDISSIAISPEYEDIVLIANRAGGIVQYDVNDHALSYVPGAEDRNASDVLLTTNGELWYWDYESRSLRYRPSLYSSSSDELELPTNKVMQLVELPDGRVVANFLDRGFYELAVSGRSIREAPFLGLQNHIWNSVITYMYLDNTGAIWVGKNYESILRYDLLGEEHKLTDEYPIAGDVYGVVGPTDYGSVYIGGIYGVHEINTNDKSFSKVKDRANLLPEKIYSLVGDEAGNLWLSSDFGVFFYDPELDSTHQFSLEDGLQNLEFNSHVSAKNSNGSIFFGGISGLNAFQSQKITLRDNPSYVKAYSPRVNYESSPEFARVSDGMSVELPYRSNTISLEAMAIDYASPMIASIRYRLSNVNDSWVVVDNYKTLISYPNLSPGEYTLFINGSNADGIWNRESYTLGLAIEPPFYMTWWFRTAGIIVVAYSIYSIARFRYKRKLERQNQLLKEQAIRIEGQEALERERTRIASEMHDDLGSGLTTIKFLSERALRNTEDDKEIRNIEKIASQSSELVTNMSEIIWAMNSRFNDTDEFTAYLRRYATDFLGIHGMSLEFESKMNSVQEMSAEQRRSTFLVCKEVLHNAVKYSQAKRVSIEVSNADAMQIRIDELGGVGFNVDEMMESGNGLYNIRQRMARIEGSIEQGSTLSGMQTVITVPINARTNV